MAKQSAYLQRREAELDATFNAGAAADEPNCMKEPRLVGMKESLLALHDRNEKMRALICEIRSGLFGLNPPEWNMPECNCAQDVTNDCNAISTQSIELLMDILRGLNGD